MPTDPNVTYPNVPNDLSPEGAYNCKLMLEDYMKICCGPLPDHKQYVANLLKISKDELARYNAHGQDDYPPTKFLKKMRSSIGFIEGRESLGISVCDNVVVPGQNGEPELPLKIDISFPEAIRGPATGAGIAWRASSPKVTIELSRQEAMLTSAVLSSLFRIIRGDNERYDAEEFVRPEHTPHGALPRGRPTTLQGGIPRESLDRMLHIAVSITKQIRNNIGFEHDEGRIHSDLPPAQHDSTHPDLPLVAEQSAKTALADSWEAHAFSYLFERYLQIKEISWPFEANYEE